MVSSSTASTSAQGSAPAAPVPAPSHPAFPALIPSHLRSAPAPTTIPSTPAQVLKLIQTCTSPHSISSTLVPSLAAVAAAKKANEKDREKAMLKGEEVLAVFDQDLRGMKEDEVRAQAAGLVFVVSARMHPNHADQPSYNAELLTLAVNICLVGDAHQLYDCGPRLGDLAWGIVRLAKHLRTVESALHPLQALLRRVVEPACLSGVHAAFLEACLLTGQYQAAYEIIECPQVDVKTFSPTYLDVITFYHHAGLICAADGLYETAVEMFSIAVSVPTTYASAIQLAAAKRAILCGILNDGKLIHFPKYISGSVTRLIERNAKEYVKLAEAFMTSNWETVRGFIGTKEFKDDYNLGLLEHIIAAIPQRQILQIKDLYSRMRISDLAKRLDMTHQGGEQDVVGLLDYMVGRGMLRATLDNSTGTPIVSFMEEDTDYTSPQALTNLKRLNHLSMWLETELTKSGRDLGVNREYLKKQAQSLENAGKGSTGAKVEDMDDFMAGAMGRGGVRGGKLKGVGLNMADMGF